MSRTVFSAIAWIGMLAGGAFPPPAYGLTADWPTGSGFLHPDGLVIPKDSGSRTNGRGEYALVVYAGGGLSYYAASIGVPDGLQNVRISRLGPAATFRLMWHPDRRLRLGFESGWITMYSYTSQLAGKAGKVRVSAIPLLLVWSMPITKRFHLMTGTGTYLIKSHLKYDGSVNTTKLTLGWMVGASYHQPLSKNLELATEAKWMRATDTEDAGLVLQLQLVWKFLRW